MGAHLLPAAKLFRYENVDAVAGLGGRGRTRTLLFRRCHGLDVQAHTDTWHSSKHVFEVFYSITYGQNGYDGRIGLCMEQSRQKKSRNREIPKGSNTCKRRYKSQPPRHRCGRFNVSTETSKTKIQIRGDRLVASCRPSSMSSVGT